MSIHIPLRGFSVLIIFPVWYPDGSPPTQPKGLNPLEGFINVDHSACIVPWWFPPTQPKGLNPLEGFSQCWSFPLYGTLMFPPQPKGLNPLRFLTVIIFPVWYPDGSPPQPKGLNPLWGFSQCWSFRLYGTLMVPPQPKGLNPLEGFLSVDHSPCMVPWWFPPSPNLKGLNPLAGFSQCWSFRLYGTLMVPPHPT